MEVIIVNPLVFIILSFLMILITQDRKYIKLIAFVPVIAFMSLQVYEFTIINIVLVALVFSYYIFKSIKSNTILPNTKTIALMWTILIFHNISYVTDLIVFFILIEYCMIINTDYKIKQLDKTDFIINTLLVLILSFPIILLNSSNSLKNYAEISMTNSDLMTVFISLTMIVICGYANSRRKEEFNSNSVVEILKYNLIKNAYLPFLFASTYKKIILHNLVNLENIFYIIISLFLIVIFIYQVLVNKLNVKDLFLLKYNTLSICFVYMISESINELAFISMLFLNVILFVSMNKNNNKYLKYLFIGAPLSPLFFYKIIQIKSIDEAQIIFLLAMIVFNVLPFIFNKQISEERIEQ